MLWDSESALLVQLDGADGQTVSRHTLRLATLIPLK